MRPHKGTVRVWEHPAGEMNSFDGANGAILLRYVIYKPEGEFLIIARTEITVSSETKAQTLPAYST